MESKTRYLKENLWKGLVLAAILLPIYCSMWWGTIHSCSESIMAGGVCAKYGIALLLATIVLKLWDINSDKKRNTAYFILGLFFLLWTVISQMGMC